MGTFAQWVKAQEGRDDAIGYFARYWDERTPGKISSVGGIERHLGMLIADYPAEPPDGQSVPAWSRGKAALDAAMAGYRLAVDEFHKENEADSARLAGEGAELHITRDPAAGTAAEGQPSGTQPATADDGKGKPAAAKRQRKAPETAHLDGERLARVEELLQTVAEQNAIVIKLLVTLMGGDLEDAAAMSESEADDPFLSPVPEAIDWGAMMLAADFGGAA